MDKYFFSVYPIYFDKNIAKSGGRKFKKEFCRPSCTLSDIQNILIRHKIKFLKEEKVHPQGGAKGRLKIFDERKKILNILKEELNKQTNIHSVKPDILRRRRDRKRSKKNKFSK